MPLCADAASGALARGYDRERVIRLHGGAQARRRPARDGAGACKATHVLLPSWAVPRHIDAVGVIAVAPVASALHGARSARIGADLSVPADTVRGWLHRLHPAPTGCFRRRWPCPAAPPGP